MKRIGNEKTTSEKISEYVYLRDSKWELIRTEIEWNEFYDAYYTWYQVNTRTGDSKVLFCGNYAELWQFFQKPENTTDFFQMGKIWDVFGSLIALGEEEKEKREKVKKN